MCSAVPVPLAPYVRVGSRRFVVWQVSQGCWRISRALAERCCRVTVEMYSQEGVLCVALKTLGDLVNVRETITRVPLAFSVLERNQRGIRCHVNPRIESTDICADCRTAYSAPDLFFNSKVILSEIF